MFLLLFKLLCIGIVIAFLVALAMQWCGTPPPSDPIEAEATKPYHEDAEYVRSDLFVPPRDFSLEQKVVLITGGSSGVGKAVAAELCRLGATVVVTARSEARAKLVAASIMQGTRGSAHGMALELSSLADIRRFAADFLKEYSRLDMLCLNAGLGGRNFIEGTPFVTEDGFEVFYASNYLGHFLLLNLLLPVLKATDGDVRITATSSIAHWTPTPELEDLLPGSRTATTAITSAAEGSMVYSNTKLAQILMCFELQRRLRVEAPQITVTPLTPGLVNTSILEHYRGTELTPDEGAQTTLYALLSPEMRGATGFFLQPYWSPRNYRAPLLGPMIGVLAFEAEWQKWTLGVYKWLPSPAAHRREFGKQLWEESMRAVGMQA